MGVPIRRENDAGSPELGGHRGGQPTCGLKVTVPNGWRRVEDSGACQVVREDDAARLEFNVALGWSGATARNCVADLRDRLHQIAEGFQLRESWDECTDDRPRPVVAASFAKNEDCYRIWEVFDRGFLISAIFRTAEEHFVQHAAEAERIVRSATVAATRKRASGGMLAHAALAVALMLLCDTGVFIFLAIVGDLSRYFISFMLLWLLWAPCMALGWVMSQGRLRVIGLVLAIAGDLGATVWLAGVSVFLLLVLFGALQQPDLALIAVGLVCLVSQLFHFLSAAGAVTRVAALVGLVFQRKRFD